MKFKTKPKDPSVRFENKSLNYTMEKLPSHQGSPKTQKDVDRILTMRISKDLDYRFKVILLGDSKVGKSSIVNRVVEEGFNLKYNETTFFDTVNKKLRVNNQYDVLL